MGKNAALFSYFGLGASFMYLVDPDRGARRRAGVRNKFVHFGHQIVRAADVVSRDLGHRTKGTLSEIKHSIVPSEKVSDEVLVERVRSKLGRVVSHPHAIHVSVQEGRISLSGLTLVNELEELVYALRSVPGVQSIENRLEVHKSEENIPSLQAGIPRRGQKIDLFQASWSPATRFLVGSSALSLLYLGSRRKDYLGTLGGPFSLALIVRSLTNLELKHLLGIGSQKSITVRKSINIDAAVEEVYRFWSDFTNFPRFMTVVREVTLKGDGRSHWVIEGPAGVPVGWDAITTRAYPNELLAWKSLPGSTIQNAGRVQFHPNEKGGTRIDIDFSYSPPMGALGHALASLLKSSPKSKLEEALVQMKTLIEEGPSERQVSGFH